MLSRGNILPQRTSVVTIPRIVLGLRRKKHELASACEVSMVRSAVVRCAGGMTHFRRPY
jgi:hypothetical protein